MATTRSATKDRIFFISVSGLASDVSAYARIRIGSILDDAIEPVAADQATWLTLNAHQIRSTICDDH